jgi:hypothetical protein
MPSIQPDREPFFGVGIGPLFREGKIEVLVFLSLDSPMPL